MLVLTRKIGEQILIADHILLVVKSVKGDRVRIAIDAPKSVHVVRGELRPKGRPVLSTQEHSAAPAEAQP